MSASSLQCGIFINPTLRTRIDELKKAIAAKETCLVVDWEQTVIETIGANSMWELFNKATGETNNERLRSIKSIYTEDYADLTIDDFLQWIEIVNIFYKEIKNKEKAFKEITHKIRPFPGVFAFWNLFDPKKICIISCAIGEVIKLFLSKVEDGKYKDVRIFANFITQKFDQTNSVFPRSKSDFLTRFIKENHVDPTQIIVMGNSNVVDGGMFWPQTTNIFVTDDSYPRNNNIVTPDNTSILMSHEDYGQLIKLFT